MEKYDEMLLLFYRTGKWQEWNPYHVKYLLSRYDKKGQLLYERDEQGLRWFLAYMRCQPKDIHRLEKWDVPKNGGSEVVPIFFAARGGYKTIKRALLKAKKLGNGHGWSWRRGRLMSIGEVCHRRP